MCFCTPIVPCVCSAYLLPDKKSTYFRYLDLVTSSLSTVTAAVLPGSVKKTPATRFIYSASVFCPGKYLSIYGCSLYKSPSPPRPHRRSLIRADRRSVTIGGWTLSSSKQMTSFRPNWCHKLPDLIQPRLAFITSTCPRLIRRYLRCTCPAPPALFWASPGPGYFQGLRGA